MAELPKDRRRTIVTSVVTPAVEELVERYARRARRVVARAPEGRAADRRCEYVHGRPRTRGWSTLRRLLDEIDPTSALVFAREADERGRGRATCFAHSATPKDGEVSLRPPRRRRERSCVVLYDLPASHEELREAGRRGAARGRARSAASADESARALRRRHAQAASRFPSRPRRRGRATRARIRAELRALLESGNSVARAARARAAARRVRRHRDRGGGAASCSSASVWPREPRGRAANVRRRASTRLMRLPRERTPDRWCGSSSTSARATTCVPRDLSARSRTRRASPAPTSAKSTIRESHSTSKWRRGRRLGHRARHRHGDSRSSRASCVATRTSRRGDGRAARRRSRADVRALAGASARRSRGRGPR